MFSVDQQNIRLHLRNVPIALSRLADLEVNNYTGADSWLEAKQKFMMMIINLETCS